MRSRELRMPDSEGVQVRMIRDEQGDIYLEVGGPCFLPSVKNCARFCAGHADGGYAPNTKKALRALWDAMEMDGATRIEVTP